MSRPVLILALSCSLGACASTGSGAGSPMQLGGAMVGDAIAAPLRDLNLFRKTAPPVLVEAAKGPYVAPETLDCTLIEEEIRRLDLALGPDVDAPAVAATATLRARGTQLVSNAAVDAMEDLTTGWIPYRSVVRQITGASRHSKRLEEAVHAGAIRRAFLKGLRHRERCGEEAPVEAVVATTSRSPASPATPAAPLLVEAAASAPTPPATPAAPASPAPADARPQPLAAAAPAAAHEPVLLQAAAE